MRNCAVILLVFLSGFGCSKTYRIIKIANATAQCENNWQYFKLTKPIKGVVLSFTRGNCGYANTHSNTIIITNNIDTIRVDGPCYTDDRSISDSVIVTPYVSENVKGTIGDLKFDCTVKKTCYGIIKKIK